MLAPVLQYKLRQVGLIYIGISKENKGLSFIQKTLKSHYTTIKAGIFPRRFSVS